jgi:hypothetical protein
MGFVELVKQARRAVAGQRFQAMRLVRFHGEAAC